MFGSDYTSPRKEPSLRRICQKVSGDLAACEALSQQRVLAPAGNANLGVAIPADLPSPLSTTSAFLLGIHNNQTLDDVNFPDFVREHQATLTFPEKVSLRGSDDTVNSNSFTILADSAQSLVSNETSNLPTSTSRSSC